MKTVPFFLLFGSLLIVVRSLETFDSATTTNEQQQPLLLYDFKRSECRKGQCPNLGFLTESQLFRNASLTTFVAGNVGIESKAPSAFHDDDSVLVADDDDNPPIFANTRSLVTFKEQSGGDSTSKPGLSIGLWIRSLEQGEDTIGVHKKNILTVGAKHIKNEMEYSYMECDDRMIDLQLQLSNQTLAMVFRTSDMFHNKCQKLKTRTLDLKHGALTHVSMVLKDKYQQVYINGKPANKFMEEPFDSDLAHWNRDGMLELFSYHGQPRWRGQVYRLEVAEEHWEQDDILKVMARGIASAVPVIHNITHRIYEDAEILPGSHAIEWYRNPNSFSDAASNLNRTFPTLNLSVSFLDEEVSSLLETLGINHPKPPKIQVYILEHHGNGDLYYLDGMKVITTKKVTHLSKMQLVYIPEHNAYSHPPGTAFATIEYCVALEEVSVRSQCLGTAFINVIVDAVNDPPIAFVSESGPYTAHEGIFEEPLPIRLQGNDVDLDDSIAAFEIVSPPRLGYLYLSVPIRREDGLYHGTLLSDLQYMIPGSEAFVEYRYTGNHTIQDDMVVDSFDFRVRDSRGSWSLPITTNIQVLSSLKEITPFTSVQAQEDVLSTITLQGRDDSGLNRSFGFLVHSVPPQEDAVVYSPGGLPLHEGDIFFEQRGKAEVGLLVRGRLCDDNEVASTFLEFRVASNDESGRISSLSDQVKHNVTVDCRVKPFWLVVPQDVLQVQASTELWNDPCGGYMYNLSRIGDRDQCQSALLIDNIRLLSNVNHSRRVLVVVSSQNGLLTLNPEHRQTVRLLNDQAMMRSSIQFKALPSQIDTILSGLHFQSRRVGVDEIRISVEYGECQSQNDTCDQVTQSIPVKVLPATPKKPDILFDSFPWIQLPFTLTLLLLVKLKGKLRVLLAIHQSHKNHDKSSSHAPGTVTSTTVADSDTIRWQQFYDDSTGFYYYLNLDDDTVTWDVPLDEPFLPCESYCVTL